MFDFGMNHAPRDEYTDSVVRYLKAMQLPEGDWLTIESRRPPMAAGRHQTAALAIYSLKQYGPPADKADTDKVIARAAAWLETATPATTQDRAFQVMGLAWANATVGCIGRKSIGRDATPRWRLEPATDYGFGRLCNG